MTTSRDTVRRTAATAVAALLLLVAGAPGALAATTGDAAAPVLLVGVTGVRWDDVTPEATPALDGLARDGAVGSAVVRGARPSTCPSAGWLAVGAGGRADDPRQPDGCRALLDPGPHGDVPGWAEYTASVEESAYDTRIGLLGDALTATGTTATAVGPGAAVALATAAGTVAGTSLPRPEDDADLSAVVSAALRSAALVAVDAGEVRDDAAGEATPRAQQVRAVDDRVAAVLDAARRSGTDPTVLVVSVADSGTRPHLQLAAATGPVPGAPGERFRDGTLGSASTRQPGLLQVTDLAPTLLDALGLRDAAPAGALVGAPVRLDPDDRDTAARVDALVDQDRRAQAVAPRVGGYYVWWVGLNLVLYAVVTVGLTGSAGRGWSAVLRRLRPGPTSAAPAGATPATARDAVAPRHARRALLGVRAAGVLVAAVPVATFLANLVPWWRAGSSGWVLALLVAGWAAAVAVLALGVPAWRDRPLGPLAVVGAVTAAVLGTDVALGARLSLDSLMGPGSLVAGRFYGFGNPALALFATATVLTAVAATDPLLRRGRRGAAVAVVVGAGALALGVVSGVLARTPTTGANFGGPPALVAGFLVLAALTAGVRLTWRRLALVLLAGLATSVVLAVLDWLRPAGERTHLGRFVETVLDGGLATVLLRKAGTNLRILLGSEQTLLAVAGLLLVVVLLGRPARSAIRASDGGPYAWLSGGAPLRRLTTDAPALVPGLVALAVTLGFAFVVNDSGVVLPATGVGLAVPLLVAACATWLLRAHPAATASRPRSGSSAGAGRRARSDSRSSTAATTQLTTSEDPP